MVAVGEVDFSNIEEADAWFFRQSRQTSSMISCRAVVRVLANLILINETEFSEIALPSFRAVLLSSLQAHNHLVKQPKDFASYLKQAVRQAHSLADSPSYFGFSVGKRLATLALLDGIYGCVSENSHTIAGGLVATANSLGHFVAENAAAKYIDQDAVSLSISAANWDAKQELEWLAKISVWGNSMPPWPFVENHQSFLKLLLRNRAWSFWRRLYEGIWNGTFDEWELAQKVIEIPNKDWEEGHEHIGKVIEGIEERMLGEPLDQDALTKHLGQVISFPTVHHDFAAGTSLQISNAIATYKQEAPANFLPDGFEQFERLPKAFGNIADAIASDVDKDAKIAALQAEVNQLHSIIVQLRLDLSDARVALANRKLDAVEVAQMRTFGEKAQTFLTNITLIGAIGMGAFTFFGVDEDELKYDALKVQLDELTNQMQAVEATESVEIGP